MNKIEQLEQQLAAMQQDLEDLKKANVEEEKPKAMLPMGGDYFVNGWFSGAAQSDHRLSGSDQNIFPDKETAEAYADAFRVMLELRRQPGSGQLDAGYGWIVECCGDTDWFSTERNFVLCPPFPSKELAEQAGAAVGIERIVKAYATLSNIKGE